MGCLCQLVATRGRPLLRPDRGVDVLAAALVGDRRRVVVEALQLVFRLDDPIEFRADGCVVDSDMIEEPPNLVPSPLEAVE